MAIDSQDQEEIMPLELVVENEQVAKAVLSEDEGTGCVI